MREYEIRTTDIIGSDYETSQDEHIRTDLIAQEFLESRRSRDMQPHATSPVQTEATNHCTAPPDPSQQRHCSPSAPTAQAPPSFDPATASASSQGLGRALSSPIHTLSSLDTPSQPAPLAPQAPHPSEAAALPSTVAQAVPRPQGHTQTQGAGTTRPAHVTGPPSEAEKLTITPTNATSAPASPTTASSSTAQAACSSTESSPVSDTPVPGFATLGRRLMLSGPDPHHQNHIQQQHGPSHLHYPGAEHAHAQDTSKKPCYSAHTPQLHPPSYSNYPTISIPLPHPQPPLPEKRHPPVQPGFPSDGAATLRPAGGHAPPSSSQHQLHVTFSPTVGEIAAPAGQNDGSPPVESENANRVSVKFVQDSSRFWYKPGISREQGRPFMFIVFFSNDHMATFSSSSGSANIWVVFR